MNTGLEKQDADNRRLIESVRQALDVTHLRLLESSKQDWERYFSAADPSDACVSISITSGDSRERPLPCAGIIREGRRSLLNGSGQSLLA